MASNSLMSNESKIARLFLADTSVARILAIVAVAIIWEFLSRSGYFFHGAIPTLASILEAIIRIISDGNFYEMLATTAFEVAIALAIGLVLGGAIGLLFGTVPFASEAYESYIYYFGTTPKIILLPIMIMWFGIGLGSKIAMGAASCMIPIALGVAAAVRDINPSLLRVGRSLRLTPMQMLLNIYIPATRISVINSIRIGFGICIVGVLLAETKLSRAGLGFMVMEYFRIYDMPSMYGLILLIFVLSGCVNALMAHLMK